ncbi:hypothetical protein PENSPDRAFT_605295 [Peniophora sp. CONT]|nr:hypothetical protein PENSPDRAFT_605295 [Peniophora sp. CONT]
MSHLISAPPSLPPSIIYTSCYCEENVWLLAQHFQANVEVVRDWDIYVLFISNENKTVALWRQKARPDVVVWDYHVILLLRRKCRDEKPPSCSSWIYDLDTTLGVPCEAGSYLSETFRSCPDMYTSRFRVIPALIFLDEFASDRSHMLRPLPSSESGEGATNIADHQLPVPSYPPICGPKAQSTGVLHNLMTHFVDMTVEGFGEVVDLTAVLDLLITPVTTY